MNVNSKALIKSLAAANGIKIKEIAEEYSKRTGREMTLANLSNRLGRDSLKYSEAELIADIMGYEIEWKKKQL